MAFLSAMLMLPIFLMLTAPAEAAVIGIRFVASAKLGQNTGAQAAIREMLAGYVDELNVIYRESKVDLEAEMVEIAFSAFEAVEAEELLADMAGERNGFVAIFQRADEVGADYTVAVTGDLLIRGKPGCGRAYAVNRTPAAISSTKTALAVINPACGTHTLAHELGHLMGLNHGALVDYCRPGQGHLSAITPYANGYGEGNCDARPQAGEFGTIMVGGWMGVVTGKWSRGSLPLYSNSQLFDERCGKSKRCGDPKTGDAARVLNEYACYYASHEEPDVHVLPYADPALRRCIEQRYRGREIVELEELACPDAGIVKLDGVERLTALRRLDLRGNYLEDISPLEGLPGEQVLEVDLRGNRQLACDALRNLERRYPGRVIHPEVCRKQGRQQAVVDSGPGASLAGIDFNHLLAKIENFMPISGRGNIIKVKYNGLSLTIRDESYNANPLSMKASIDALASSLHPPQSRVLVLGDMLELGSDAEYYHEGDPADHPCCATGPDSAMWSANA